MFRFGFRFGFGPRQTLTRKRNSTPASSPGTAAFAPRGDRQEPGSLVIGPGGSIGSESFVPRRLPGLPSPLPSSGTLTFKLVGDMTIHGVTSGLTWDVTATLPPTAVTGQATTRFLFCEVRADDSKGHGTAER